MRARSTERARAGGRSPADVRRMSGPWQIGGAGRRDRPAPEMLAPGDLRDARFARMAPPGPSCDSADHARSA